MKKNEKFPWPMDEGAAVDYASRELIFAIKDDEWNEDQLESAKQPFEAEVCYDNGLVFFLLEGGPLDTCDFYFNIQECDDREELLQQQNLEVQALLIDANDVIRAVKSTTLSTKQTAQLMDLLQKQNQTEFMPGEYDCNVEGMQAAFEPAELARYAKFKFELR